MHFRKIAAALCAVLSVTLASAAAASPKVAVSDHKFMVNGKAVTPQAYNVDGYNYFKLRDVAYLLSDTTAPFNVTWTPSQSSVINLISGQKYQKVGGELSASTLSSLKVSASTFKVLLNGSAVSFRGYLINDNNYYSIADIADAIGFEAGWDNATRTVRLTTPAPDPEQPDNNNSPATISIPMIFTHLFLFFIVFYPFVFLYSFRYNRIALYGTNPCFPARLTLSNSIFF